MVEVLQNRTEIQRMQLNLMKNAQYFINGMGNDSHLHDSSFFADTGVSRERESSDENNLSIIYLR